MKNMGKCWKRPLDQTMLSKAPPLKCLANSKVVGDSSASPLINPNGEILIPEIKLMKKYSNHSFATKNSYLYFSWGF